MELEKSVQILLVEDDRIDEKAFLRAIHKLQITNPVTIAHDGLEAWEILKGANGRPSLPRPYMIVLDINMPRMSGLELLQKLREDPELHDSIVFILTTSNDDEDKIEAFNLNVAGYMLKSDVGNSFLKAVELVDNYWRVAEFPQPTGIRPRISADDRRRHVRNPDSRGVL
ncbi:MAG: response regulator [Gammaproteobacteria bacterium]